MGDADAGTALAQQLQLWWEQAQCFQQSRGSGLALTSYVKGGSSVLHLHHLGKGKVPVVW